MDGINDNLKIRTLSVKNACITLTMGEGYCMTVVEALKTNVSLTDLFLEENYGIDLEFTEVMETELEKNRQIVESIFPKLVEQEEAA